MESNKKMMDLVYLGYAYEEGSAKMEEQFIKEVKDRFPDCELIDAYNEIKGYRREVILSDELKDDYYTWIFAFGWHECSLTANLMMRGEDPKDAIRYIELAKSQYPENFKPEENAG
jgi:hypothetical protein